MPRVVVLGTGTGVGKTHVSAALARALSWAYPLAAVGAMKPVETGVPPEEGTRSDAARLASASVAAWTPPARALYAFDKPVAPYVAAAHAQADAVDLRRVVDWVQAWEQRNATSRNVWSIIESAGGVFSPLSAAETNFDLARALEPALWVVVAPDALGVLHDTTATLEALRARGRSPDFVVLSAARERDASTGTNARALRELGIADPAAVLGRDDADLSALVAAFAALGA